jgi:dihydrofolate reductase
VLIAGAETWAQSLNKGLLDQLEIHLAPVLLGGGIRLFDRVEAGKLALKAGAGRRISGGNARALPGHLVDGHRSGC